MADGRAGPEWTNNAGKTTYGAAGKADVLLIVSGDGLSHPDVMQRRPAIELTEEVREKLENQGIAREDLCDDLTLLKARYGLDTLHHTIARVERSQLGGETLTRETVLESIQALMKKCKEDEGGVVLHYTGHGRRDTGDWCFEDGFITFRDLADLYLQLLRGHVLCIVTDCSYSGCWVKECMTFLDEQGVGPCGHSAKEKRILLKVRASCLSHQTPRQLSLSVHGCRNDKNTGLFAFLQHEFISQEAKIADAQHISDIDFTMIRCGQDSIDEECLCLPEANWHTWNTRNRIRNIIFKPDRAWCVLLVKDDDEAMLDFLETIAIKPVKCEDYGEVLKSGKEEELMKEELESATQKYHIYREKPNQQ